MPDAKPANIDSLTHKKEKTTHEHIAQGTARRAKTVGKNDRRHDTCGSNLPVTYIDPRIHFPQNSRTSRSQATGTEHPNNFNKQTLRLSHCGEHGPKPTWWHTSSRSSVGIYPTVRINAGRTKLRGDLIVTALDQRQPTWCILALQWWNLFMIHAKKNSIDRLTSNIYAILLNMLALMARPTTPMRCPMQYEHTHRLTHSQERNTTNKHIANRLPLDAASTRLNKKNNTVAGRTTVVTTLAVPTSAVT